LTFQSASGTALWPLAVFFILVVALTVAIVSLSALLGQRHMENRTGEPYESGVPPTGSARIRFGVKFYLMAMFFVIFDLEAVFVFAWANSALSVGWSGYIEIAIFIAVLGIALFYLWRVGALDWGSRGERPKNRKSQDIPP